MAFDRLFISIGSGFHIFLPSHHSIVCRLQSLLDVTPLMVSAIRSPPNVTGMDVPLISNMSSLSTLVELTLPKSWLARSVSRQYSSTWIGPVNNTVVP